MVLPQQLHKCPGRTDVDGDPSQQLREDRGRVFRMDTVVVTMVLLGSVCSVLSVPAQPREAGVSFSVVFSEETRLLVTVRGATLYDDDSYHLHERAAGSDPQVQIMSPVESPGLLVCLLRGLKSPPLDVLWWVDEQIMKAPVQVQLERGLGYSATSVLEVSAEERRSRSSFWCGTVEDGRVYRQKLCLIQPKNFT